MKKYKRMPVSRYGFPKKVKIVSPRRGRPRKSSIIKKDVFEEFCKWSSLPSPVREPKTQKDFGKKWGVTGVTLSKWKSRQLFWETMSAYRIAWTKDKTPDVINGLFRKASTRGDAAEVKLWMQMVEDWSEKPVALPQNLTIIGIQGISNDDLQNLVKPEKTNKKGGIEEGEVVSNPVKP